MSFRLVIKQLAETDISEAAKWYSRIDRRVARNFIDSVDKTLSGIKTIPYAFPIVDGTYRRAITRKFPFAIYFTVEEDEVVVFGIFHCSRHPEKWKNRFADDW